LVKIEGIQALSVPNGLHFSIVLGVVIKCKQYSGITLESGTHVKSVKITLNIFAVHIPQEFYWKFLQEHIISFLLLNLYFCSN
jgi:hypothetical protein